MKKKQKSVYNLALLKFFFMGIIVLGVVAGFTYYFLTSVLTNSKASSSALEIARRCFKTSCKVGAAICPSKLVNGKYGLLPTANRFCQQCHSMCYSINTGERNRPNTNPFIPPPRD